MLACINAFLEKMNHLVAYSYHTSDHGPTTSWQRRAAIHKWIISVWHCVRARVCVMVLAHGESIATMRLRICSWVHLRVCVRVCVCTWVCLCVSVCVRVCVRERVRTSFGHLSHFERKKSCFGVFSTHRGFHQKIPHMLKVFPQAQLECQRSAFVELITRYFFSLFCLLYYPTHYLLSIKC